MMQQFYYLAGLVSVMVICHSTWSALLLHGENTVSCKSVLQRLLKLSLAMVYVLFVHCIEAGVFAAFYYFKGALSSIEEAMYFSLASYATVGYGDVLLPPDLRLTGAAEGLAGTLMISWTVAILVGYFNKH